MEQPLLTLSVIAYNEHDYLDDILSDIYSQTYPKDRIDLILVDSCSKDDTMDIFKCFCNSHSEEYYNIRIFVNENVTVQHGLNIVLDNAAGELFLRIDAHAKLPCDFVEKEVAAVKDHDAAGGKRPCIIKKDTKWGNVLLMAEESMFGSSIAGYRKAEKPCFAKSLFHGIYRMDILRKIGFYDERLARTEDNEMSYRLRSSGYKLYYDPDIVSYQYMRPDLRRMVKQKYSNGKWIGITSGICPKCLMYYHFVPFLFVMAIIFCAVLCCFSFFWPMITLAALYTAADLLMTLTAVIPSGKKSAYCLLLPFIFPVLHIAYGIGTLCGFTALIFRRKKYVGKREHVK